MEPEEAEALICALADHIVKPAFIYRHQWRRRRSADVGQLHGAAPRHPGLRSAAAPADAPHDNGRRGAGLGPRRRLRGSAVRARCACNAAALHGLSAETRRCRHRRTRIMTDNIIVDTATRIFADLCEPATVNAAEEGHVAEGAVGRARRIRPDPDLGPRHARRRRRRAARRVRGVARRRPGHRAGAARRDADGRLAAGAGRDRGARRADDDRPDPRRRPYRAVADGTLRGRARQVPFARNAGHIVVLARQNGTASVALVPATRSRSARRRALPASRATRSRSTARAPPRWPPAGRARHDRARAARRRGAGAADGRRARTHPRPVGAMVARPRAVRPADRQVPGGAAQSRDAGRRGRGGRRRRRRRRRGDRAARRRQRATAAEVAIAKSGSARRPAPAPRSPIRCTARWASPTSIRCTTRRGGCGPGARSSATRRIGPTQSRPDGRGARRRRAVAVCHRTERLQRDGIPVSGTPRLSCLTPLSREAIVGDRWPTISISIRSTCRPSARNCARRCATFCAGRSRPARSRRIPARAPFSAAKASPARSASSGWIGMTWPKQYGGHERTHLERYVVIEEMLAHRAPTRAYSTADRQSGPMILRYGQQEIKDTILPRIASGELCFCIGLSEPNSGSDVFAASTRATKTDGGWLVNGRKIWTSNAHNSDYMIALLRTSPPTKENRRHGLTQFLIDCKIAGDHDPPDHQPDRPARFQRDLLRRRVRARSAPDRRGRHGLEAGDRRTRLRAQRPRPLARNLPGACRAGAPRRPRARASGSPRASAARSRIWRHCGACRSASPACCRPARRRGSRPPSSRISAPTGSRRCRTRRACWRPPTGNSAPDSNDDRFEEALRHTTLIAPKVTIQGGTREVLRGIIARGLGLR